ncbi:MAG TPA: hypothetical protein VF590_07150, partial [Isosphaeraceae bacterium]
MDLQPPDRRPGPEPEPPDPAAILDALRDHPEWDERRRDEQFDRLIARYPADQLMAAARARLADLRGDDGAMALRLVEALGGPAVLEELAGALVTQRDLPAERAWEALSLLEGTGLLEAHPELAERWDELAE